MAIAAAVLDVDVEPVQVGPDPTDSVSGTSVAVTNTGSVTVYLGGADVDTTEGFPLAADASIAFKLDGGEVLYAVSDAPTTVNYIAEGV